MEVVRGKKGELISKIFIIIILAINIPIYSYANPIDSTIKQSVKESIQEIKDSTKESIKESLVPNIDKTSFGTLIVQIMLTIIVGMLTSGLLSALSEPFMCNITRFTIVSICITLVSKYIETCSG